MKEKETCERCWLIVETTHGGVSNLCEIHNKMGKRIKVCYKCVDAVREENIENSSTYPKKGDIRCDSNGYHGTSNQTLLLGGTDLNQLRKEKEQLLEG